MLKMFRLSAMFLFIPTLLSAQPSVPVANDDIHSVINGRCADFDFGDLVANDETWGGQAQIEIVQPPRSGNLQSLGNSFSYRPDSIPSCTTLTKPHFGLDLFTYRLRLNGQASKPATVWLRFIPSWAPISGRWPTALCPTTDCDADCPGKPAPQIGFYGHTSSSFTLCHWQGQEVTSCQSYPVPFAPIHAWPVVANINSDPWDELGIQDLSSGKVRWFRPNPDCNGQPCLEFLGTQSGIGPGREAVAGSWRDGHAPMAFHDLEDLSFHFFGQSRSGYKLMFGDLRWSAQPLAGDWHGQDTDTVALFNHLTASLHYRLDHDLGLTFVATPPSLPNQNPVVPFSGRLQTCSNRSFLGLYSPQSGDMMIHRLPFAPGQVPVHVVVPIDPVTGTPD